ncbi:Oxygen regulatory protein NreC [Planctomycetes bacterium MalM25]|nr:Oxygen regulatory protein NreC [Planctomycetes bacterium MalM25]
MRVALVEDHAIFRQGLASLFSEDGRIEVVCEASHGVEALPPLIDAAPDVAVIDLNLPGRSGLELFRAWREATPRAAAVILTSSRDPVQAVAAAEAGVLGYVLKEEVFDDLSKAVIEASAGRRFYSPGVSSLLVGHHAEPPCTLTPREHEVLQAVAQGDTNRRIASRLGVSVKTIESHRSNLMHKLRVRGAAELVRVAIEKGLLPTDRD